VDIMSLIPEAQNPVSTGTPAGVPTYNTPSSYGSTPGQVNSLPY